MSYRYSRWDGTQKIFAFDAEDLMAAMSDDLMRHGDLKQALQNKLKRGFRNSKGEKMPGLQELMERLRQKRQDMLKRHDLGGIMKDILERLERVKDLERKGIDRRLQEQLHPRGTSDARQPQTDEDKASPEGREGHEGRQQNDTQMPGEMPELGMPTEAMQKMLENIANKKRTYLDGLPKDPGGQIKALSDYEFMDDQARQEFEELRKMLQQQIAQSYFKGMQQAIQNMTPEELARMRNMVRDLNQMLKDRMEGKEPDFDAFMQKYGDFFPGVNSLDDLIEQMAQQMAQMQALMNSMSREQRQQLQDMMDALFQDDRLKFDLAQLAMNLDQLYPMEQFRERYNFQGEEPVTLQEAMAMMNRLQGLDELEKDFREARTADDIQAIDSQQVGELMGEENLQYMEQLKQITQMLEEAGFIEKIDGQYEMTPRGMRKIGQKALQDLFAHLKKDGFGKHEVHFRGTGGERIDDSKLYEFGDPFLLDLEGTMMNSLAREGAGSPLKLKPEDFEVFRTELRTESSTVVLLDMSYSMELRDCFVAAKKVAVALDSLIRGQFPRDHLYVIGFSYAAQQIKPEQLGRVTLDDVQKGTNMQMGFMLARQLLGKHKSRNKQIIMITDGEPTAHIEEGWPYPIFNWPPTNACIDATLREVYRCTREHITINTFMLAQSNYLTDFVNQMTQINRGRAFFVDPDNLGEYVLVDYVANKAKRVR